jgi:diguanylate cyclase (GGDEF)-like protein
MTAGSASVYGLFGAAALHPSFAGLARASSGTRAEIPWLRTPLDLDHFKRYNDSNGHQGGDRLLKSAAAAWTAQLRQVDVLARYGGEEFIALLPGCGATAAADVLQRLRAATPDGQTFSAGIATWDGQETAEQLIARADAALYQAKEAGRDRSVVAQPCLETVGTLLEPGPLGINH